MTTINTTSATSSKVFYDHSEPEADPTYSPNILFGPLIGSLAGRDGSWH
jgi:hypothetical protein